MSQLTPCPYCQRHVRTSELSCPFCAADIAASMARVVPRRAAPAGLSRAAMLALGASVAASSAALLPGCADDHDDKDGGMSSDGGKGDGGSNDAGSVGRDGSVNVGDGSVVAVYGAPVQTDAAVPVHDAGAADAGQDAGTVPARDGGGIQPVYGAPVSDGGGHVVIYGAPVQEDTAKR